MRFHNQGSKKCKEGHFFSSFACAFGGLEKTIKLWAPKMRLSKEIRQKVFSSPVVHCTLVNCLSFSSSERRSSSN